MSWDKPQPCRRNASSGPTQNPDQGPLSRQKLRPVPHNTSAVILSTENSECVEQVRPQSFTGWEANTELANIYIFSILGT